MVYIAFVLDEISRDQILNWTQPSSGDNVYCHHVTIAFQPPEEEVEDIMDKFASCKFMCHGLVVSPQAVVARVSVDGSFIRPDGGYWHCTVVTAEGTKPVFSNRIMELHNADMTMFPYIACKQFELIGDVKLVQ